MSIFFVCGLVAPLFVSANEDEQGAFCSILGWLVRPVGFCEETKSIVVVTHQDEVVTEVEIGSQLNIMPSPVGIEMPPATIIQYSTTTQPIYEQITNEYITVQQNGVPETFVDNRISEVLAYINSLPLSASVSSGEPNKSTKSIEESFITREYLLKSLDKVDNQISDSRRSITVQSDFSNPSITDALLNGTTYLTGKLGIGTSSPSEVLSIEGAIYLAETTPTQIINRLYNIGGDLYWNGSVIMSSTTGSWSLSSGNAFRLTGNVGIGTSTPSETLTVNGTLSAGTTTARILDTGGQVCNVQAYGAVGDNSTDNYAAIMATITACPKGGVVYFPIGTYRISQTIVLDAPVTLRGAYAPRWSYSSTPRSSIRAMFGTFVGNSIIHVRDKSISGVAVDNNGGRFENLSIDGGSWGTGIHGLYFEGLVRDWKITDVDISQTSGDGFLAEVGTGSGNPRGFTIRGLSIYSAAEHGFRATALNDSYLEDVLAVGNALRGFYLSSMGETKVNNSRAVFNALEGLYLDGSSNNGGLMFTDFSTDRNDRHGVRISMTGTTTVTFNGLLTRRDGANLGGGIETPYAGVAVIGAVSQPVAPVFINGLSQLVGVDDSGNPPFAPQVGVRVTNAQYVKVDGQLWGVNEAYQDGGGNDKFIIVEDSIIKTGSGWSTTPPPLYNNKWIATSTGLFYGKSINIGSTTGSRLLNITAPSQAGARFQDTTNNVIFDMRAEDFQAFFGTFSNHQLRFQTNNTSRLTIDTNGFIGIGTTSPDQMLDVIGTIQSSALLGGAVNLTTDANGNIIRDPSDVRLKTNITDVENGLEKVLALRGVTYKWLDTERFGEQTEIGFIAQEVDKVVPEVVRKGGEYWSINTRNLLAVVVKGMQEMWDMVTGNRDRIESLEERVAELEARHNIQQNEKPETVNVGGEVDNQQVEPTPVTASSTASSSPTEIQTDTQTETMVGTITDDIVIVEELKTAPKTENNPNEIPTEVIKVEGSTTISGGV